jgi:hypothetical protein
MKVKMFKRPPGYLNHVLKNWQYFFNFDRILVIENLKTALDFSTFGLLISLFGWLVLDSRIQNKRRNKEYIVGQRKQILGMGVSKYPETSKSLRERREREKAMGGTNNNFWSCSLAA